MCSSFSRSCANPQRLRPVARRGLGEDCGGRLLHPPHDVPGCLKGADVHWVSTTAGFEVKFVVSNGFSGLAAGADDASATMRMQPRDQAAGPKPDARAGVALRAR